MVVDAKARADAEHTIESVLFGCPGTAWETDDGNTLVLDVIRELGFRALTHEAVLMLADRQKQLEDKKRLRDEKLLQDQRRQQHVID